MACMYTTSFISQFLSSCIGGTRQLVVSKSSIWLVMCLGAYGQRSLIHCIASWKFSLVMKTLFGFHFELRRQVSSSTLAVLAYQPSNISLIIGYHQSLMRRSSLYCVHSHCVLFERGHSIANPPSTTLLRVGKIRTTDRLQFHH